ncbi:MAG: hypothetical protein Q9M50_01695 [Methylococcales bacterium]|nr:hypothetical protein [Methylococcales bacterium]
MKKNILAVAIISILSVSSVFAIGEEAGKPEMEKSEAGRPDAGKPEMEKSEAGRSDAGKPEMEKSEAGRSDAGKPEMEKSEAGRADAGKPEMGKSEAGRADAGKPEMGKRRDRISGGARADFERGELIIPCVKILQSGNPELDGGFFDVVLKQRGKSLNYEVVFGELEDKATCQPAIDAMLQSDEDSEDSDGGLVDVLGEQLDNAPEGEGIQPAPSEGDQPPPPAPEGEGDQPPPAPEGDQPAPEGEGDQPPAP